MYRASLGDSGSPTLGDKHTAFCSLPPQSAQEVAFLGNSEDLREKHTDREGIARVVRELYRAQAVTLDEVANSGG